MNSDQTLVVKDKDKVERELQLYPHLVRVCVCVYVCVCFRVVHLSVSTVVLSNSISPMPSPFLQCTAQNGG